MQLDLNDEDTELLREILNSAYRDLKYEIADTDQFDYKTELKQRERRIAALLGQVGGPLPDRS